MNGSLFLQAAILGEKNVKLTGLIDQVEPKIGLEPTTY